MCLTINQDMEDKFMLLINNQISLGFPFCFNIDLYENKLQELKRVQYVKIIHEVTIDVMQV